MVNDLTFCADAASTHARIHTLHIRAGTIQRAVGVDHTFWSAANQRISEITGLANASQDLALLTALGIRSAFD